MSISGWVLTSTKGTFNCSQNVLLELIEKDTIFVPAAWDSIEKIQIDFSSQSLPNDEEARVPGSVSRQSKTKEVLAEDAQTFLERQLKQIDKTPQVGPAQPAGPGDLYSSPTKPPSTSVEGTAPSTPARSTGRPSMGATPLKTPSTPLATPTKARHPRQLMGRSREGRAE